MKQKKLKRKKTKKKKQTKEIQDHDPVVACRFLAELAGIATQDIGEADEPVTTTEARKVIGSICAKCSLTMPLGAYAIWNPIAPDCTVLARRVAFALTALARRTMLLETNPDAPFAKLLGLRPDYYLDQPLARLLIRSMSVVQRETTPGRDPAWPYHLASRAITIHKGLLSLVPAALVLHATSYRISESMENPRFREIVRHILQKTTGESEVQILSFSQRLTNIERSMLPALQALVLQLPIENVSNAVEARRYVGRVRDILDMLQSQKRQFQAEGLKANVVISSAGRNRYLATIRDLLKEELYKVPPEYAISVYDRMIDLRADSQTVPFSHNQADTSDGEAILMDHLAWHEQDEPMRGLLTADQLKAFFGTKPYCGTAQFACLKFILKNWVRSLPLEA